MLLNFIFIGLIVMIHAAKDEGEEEIIGEDAALQDCIISDQKQLVISLAENEIYYLKLSSIFKDREYQQFKTNAYEILPLTQIAKSMPAPNGAVHKVVSYISSDSQYDPFLLISDGYFNVLMYEPGYNKITPIEGLFHNYFIQIFQDSIVTYSKQNLIHYFQQYLPKTGKFVDFEQLVYNIGFLELQQVSLKLFFLFDNSIEVFQFINKKNVQYGKSTFREMIHLTNQNCHQFSKISQLKGYRNEKLAMIQKNFILMITDLKENLFTIECYRFEHEILTYDYDEREEAFAVVFANTIQYKQYKMIHNFELTYPEIKIHVIRNYIVVQLKDQVEIYTKTLKKIDAFSTKSIHFIHADKDSNGLILVTSTDIKTILINENVFLKIDEQYYNLKEKERNVELIQTSDDKQCSYKILVQSLVKNQVELALKKLKTSYIISPINKDYSIEICSYFNRKKLSKNVLKFFSTFDTTYKYFKSYYMNDSQTWIVVVDAQNQISLYDCQTKCIKKYHQLLEIPFEFQNFLFSIKTIDLQTFLCYCQIDQCTLLKFLKMDSVAAIHEKQVFQNQVVSIIILTTQIYFIVENQVYEVPLDNLKKFPSIIQDFPKVDQLFASPFEEKHIIAIRDQTLSVFYIFNSRNSIKLIYKEEMQEIFHQSRIFIYEKYFVFLGKKSETEFKCYVYNNEKLLHVHRQKEIPLNYFQIINLLGVESNYHYNTLLIQGQLRLLEFNVLVELNIDTLVSHSIQLVYKLKNSQIPIAIQKNIITIKQENSYLSIIKYLNQNKIGDLLEKSQMCQLETEHFYDEPIELDFDDEVDQSSILDQFPTTFVLTSALEEMLIYGMYKLYSKKNTQFTEEYQV